MRKRTVGLVAGLAVAAAAFGLATWDSWRVRGTLTEFAAEKVRELSDGEDRIVAWAQPQITVTRDYLLFGPQRAKIALYMKTDVAAETDHEEHSGHRHHGPIGGIEYFLTNVDGNWVENESGHCSSEQCQIEGTRAFNEGIFNVGTEAIPAVEAAEK